MISNANMTIYNSYEDKLERVLKHKRYELYGVFWDSVKGASRLQSGTVNADEVLIIIYFKNLDMSKYLPYNKFVGDPETFTFKVGDRIIKDIVTDEVLTSASELDRNHDTYTITSVDEKDFGSPHMRHFEIRGK